MLFEMRRENKCPFLIATVIFGFLSIFNKSQASAPFEAPFELHVPHHVSNGCEASCPGEAGN